jgi:hypothetical protein
VILFCDAAEEDTGLNNKEVDDDEESTDEADVERNEDNNSL